MSQPLRDHASDPDDKPPADPRWRLSASFSLGRAEQGQPRARRVGRVLIVEDNRDSREMYALYFKVHGYDVASADDGRAGVEMGLNLKPDVIVMDLAMPGMSGAAATEYLKRDPRTRHIPVILLTGHHGRAIEERVLERGVDVFLTKPCLPEDLEGHVRRLLDARSR